MGRREPPKKPIALKLLQGTYRRDRDGDLRSMIFPGGDPKKPKGLDPIAEAFWDEWVPKLTAIGVAKEIDSPALQMMCFWWSRAKELRAIVRKISKHALTKEYFRVQVLTAQADKTFSQLAMRFGMTPSDRARIRAELPPVKHEGVGPRVRARVR
jgi:phage terminase small subunit